MRKEGLPQQRGCLNRKLDAVNGRTSTAFDCVELTVQTEKVMDRLPQVVDLRL
ncbi:MAG: hypothetical protein LBF89_01515 [Bacteroidales bacterium]|nr:hypothetical protein [Bacteroidales bacterium]